MSANLPTVLKSCSPFHAALAVMWMTREEARAYVATRGAEPGEMT